MQYYRRGLSVPVQPGAAGFRDTLNQVTTVNVVVREIGGVAAQFQAGAGIRLDDIAAFGTLVVHGLSLKDFSFAGNGAKLLLDMSYPEVVDPAYMGIGTLTQASTFVSQKAILAATPTPIYTCPVGKRAYVWLCLVHAVAADSIVIAVNRSGSVGSNQQSDFIASGTAVPGGGNLYVGTGPGNTVVLPAGGVPMAAGDVLWVSDNLNPANVTVFALESPL